MMPRMLTSPMAKFAAVLGMGALVITLGASIAMATDDTGSQNPDVTVTASLSPDVATAGDTVTGTGTVTNNTDKKRKFRIKAVLTAPDGSTYSLSASVRLEPGETYSQSQSVVVPAEGPLGEYSLTVSVKDKGSRSSATATTTIE